MTLVIESLYLHTILEVHGFDHDIWYFHNTPYSFIISHIFYTILYENINTLDL